VSRRVAARRKHPSGGPTEDRSGSSFPLPVPRPRQSRDAVAPSSAVSMAALVLDWYPASARDLPWRRPGTTPWGVLVSEFMLQQTPVARVEPVWTEWLERWPAPSALAAASRAEVLRAWGKLGYPRRAPTAPATAASTAATPVPPGRPGSAAA